jgi:hypothetical protein
MIAMTTSQKIRIAVWAGILLAFNPWVIEGAGSNCGAVDQAMMRQMKSPITIGLIGAARGHFTEAMLGKSAGGLSCAYTYWRFYIDPPNLNRS